MKSNTIKKHDFNSLKNSHRMSVNKAGEKKLRFFFIEPETLTHTGSYSRRELPSWRNSFYDAVFALNSAGSLICLHKVLPNVVVERKGED